MVARPLHLIEESLFPPRARLHVAVEEDDDVACGRIAACLFGGDQAQRLLVPHHPHGRLARAAQQPLREVPRERRLGAVVDDDDLLQPLTRGVLPQGVNGLHGVLSFVGTREDDAHSLHRRRREVHSRCGDSAAAGVNGGRWGSEDVLGSQTAMRTTELADGLLTVALELLHIGCARQQSDAQSSSQRGEQTVAHGGGDRHAERQGGACQGYRGGALPRRRKGAHGQWQDERRERADEERRGGGETGGGGGTGGGALLSLCNSTPAAAAAAAVAAPARCGSSRSHGWGATRTRCSVQLWPCSACPAVTATDTASSIAQARLGEVHVGLATEPLPRGMRQAVLLCERMSILPLVRRETRRQGGLLGVGLAQESLELPPDKIEFLLGQKSLKFAASQQGLRLLCLHVRPPPAEPRPRAQRLERRLRGLWRGIPHEGCA
mmetsp:Transcript_134906/g.349590  ORF Transcript_134906/g.349590 Transcript_134906/m.349590 type:complete len:436 (+) Transcript_134906:493-1800(+)